MICRINVRYGSSWAGIRGNSGNWSTLAEFAAHEYITALQGHSGTDYTFFSYKVITGFKIRTNLRQLPLIGIPAYANDEYFTFEGRALLYFEGRGGSLFDGFTAHFDTC